MAKMHFKYASMNSGKSIDLMRQLIIMKKMVIKFWF